MTELRLVVFDCDGTLVDSQHMIFEAMRRAFDGLGFVCPDKDRVRQIVGLNLIEGIALLAPELDDEAHARIAAGYKASFREIRQTPARREPLFPGIYDAIGAISQAGYLLGIATGKSRVGLAATLEVHELAPFFTTLQTADDAPGKPHPGMLERAMEETGIAPENTVLIGDTVFDIEMAGHAGVAAIGVSWGYHPSEDLRRLGALTIAEHGEELPGLVEDVLADHGRMRGASASK